MIDPNTIDFAKGDGLVPVVVQDAATLQVLTLAYMDRAALDETIQSGEATFFSRSRGRPWRKGETSGHVLRVRELRIDCDQDAIWVIADPAGPACHTGARSCFYRRLEDGRLVEVLAARRSARRRSRAAAERSP